MSCVTKHAFRWFYPSIVGSNQNSLSLFVLGVSQQKTLSATPRIASSPYSFNLAASCTFCMRLVFNVHRKVFVSLSVCEVTRQPLSLGDNNCQLLASTSLFFLGSASFFLLHALNWCVSLVTKKSR